MNLPAIIHANHYTKFFALALLSLASASLAHADWEVDFSHHRTSQKVQAPPPVEVRQDETSRNMINETAQQMLRPLDNTLEVAQPDQELVILNTERGFVPQTVRVRQGGRYLIHVVNINEKEKNVSFMLDAFSENHATFYGQVKTFQISPQKDGIFTFQCPETSLQGHLVVFPTVDPAKLRSPAASATPPPTTSVLTGS